MLHPGLGSTLDPLSSWQVDTHEIDNVVRLYTGNLSGVDDPEQLSRRLGLLWKKLATAPRLARLIVDYVHLQIQNASTTEAVPRDGHRFVGRLLAALGRPRPRGESSSRPSYVHDDPLYDPWVDA